MGLFLGIFVCLDEGRVAGKMENDKEDREEEKGFAQRTLLCRFFVW